MDVLRAHMSQVLKNGLVDLEALEAQARYHGFRARLRYAEAFESDRFLWDLAALPQPAPTDQVLIGQLTTAPPRVALGEADAYSS
jgi:hypothetical protein